MRTQAGRWRAAGFKNLSLWLRIKSEAVNSARYLMILQENTTFLMISAGLLKSSMWLKGFWNSDNDRTGREARQKLFGGGGFGWEGGGGSSDCSNGRWSRRSPLGQASKGLLPTAWASTNAISAHITRRKEEDYKPWGFKSGLRHVERSECFGHVGVKMHQLVHQSISRLKGKLCEK